MRVSLSPLMRSSSFRLGLIQINIILCRIDDDRFGHLNGDPTIDLYYLDVCTHVLYCSIGDLCPITFLILIARDETLV